MKNLYFILIFTCISTVSFAQNTSKFWFGIDGSYWQKGHRSEYVNSFERERSGSIRPMLGVMLNDKWGLGIMGNFQSYRQDLDQVSSHYPIYSNEPNESGIYPIVGYNSYSSDATIVNELKGMGVFLRRYVKLGEKISLNFSLYGMREKGKEGNLEIFPGNFIGYGCPGCFTTMEMYSSSYISYPYSYKSPIIETDWKFGIDAAFAYQATSWMALELRANLLEFRRQIIQNDHIQLIDPGFSPIHYYNVYGFFGTNEDFGSAIRRDGIRLGVVFQPF